MAVPAVKDYPNYHVSLVARPPQALTLGPFHPPFWSHLSPRFLTYTITREDAYDGAVKISKKGDRQAGDNGLRSTDAYGVIPLQMHQDQL